MGMSPEDRTTETYGRFNDDGRAPFAESNTNFTDGIFRMIASELPGSRWKILSYKKKY